jgi:hypothetical protein
MAFRLSFVTSIPAFLTAFGSFCPFKSQGAWLKKGESPFQLLWLFVLKKGPKAAKRTFVNLLMPAVTLVEGTTLPLIIPES